MTWGSGFWGQLGDNYGLANRGEPRRMMGELNGKFVRSVAAGVSSSHAVFKYVF
jgi:hypothetical protein